MPKRPPLTDASFLAAVFSPTKNPVPVGLRKKRIKSVTDRKASRVKRYNSMSALNQRILEQTKQREAYLRGDITIAEAKRALRNRAVDLGIVKPLKPRERTAPAFGRQITIRTRVIDHLWKQLSGGKTKKPANINAIRRGTLFMTSDQLNRSLGMTTADIKEAANNPDEKVEVREGQSLNPFWYH